MTMFDIRFEGLDELKAEWATGCAAVVADLRQGTARAVQTAARQIRADSPVRTGELRRRQFPHIRANQSGASADIQINAEHASYVQEGTSRMAARDFVGPGTQQGQQALEHAADEAVKKLKARIEG